MLDEHGIDELLRASRVIAVVGLSPDESKASNRVAKYLVSKGYRVIPVNPTASEILGEKSYPDLGSVPEKIDVVDVFRKPEDVPSVVEDAIQAGAKVIWMQEGIVNEEAAKQARQAGLQVVMDACMRATHRRLIGPQPSNL